MPDTARGVASALMARPVVGRPRGYIRRRQGFGRRGGSASGGGGAADARREVWYNQLAKGARHGHYHAMDRQALAAATATQRRARTRTDAGTRRRVGTRRYTMALYRKRKDSDTWHWCTNCTNWPTANYDERRTKPRNGKLDPQCQSKANKRACTKS